ncbi:MAG: hypothetical protein QOG86_1706 [Thermoleophilaceae bacterium]|jgi:hypothetical protein|nr:hypothetical protein [Thermoleophilaceae bacterium]
MHARIETGHAPGTADAPRRAPVPLAPLADLQRLAGNRATASLLDVQRMPYPLVWSASHLANLPVAPFLGKFKSESGLADLRRHTAQNAQGTTAFFAGWGLQRYLIEQTTNTRMAELAKAAGVTYIGQDRMTHLHAHAEMRFVKYAMDNGITLAGSMVWVSKPVCMKCALRLRSKGVVIRTSVSNVAPEEWWDPDPDGPPLHIPEAAKRVHGWGGLQEAEDTAVRARIGATPGLDRGSRPRRPPERYDPSQ